MSLNIKNPETHRLVRELAQRTGRSQTSAVEEAVRRWLAELEREQSRAQLIAELDEITARTSAALKGVDLHAEIEDLYDPGTGLPR